MDAQEVAATVDARLDDNGIEVGTALPTLNPPSLQQASQDETERSGGAQ